MSGVQIPSSLAKLYWFDAQIKTVKYDNDACYGFQLVFMIYFWFIHFEIMLLSIRKA